jgi:hypothetical protein
MAALENDPPSSMPAPQGKEYRPSPIYLWAGLCCPVFFVWMAIGSLKHIDPPGGALAIAGWYAFMTLLSVWVVVAYFRQRVYIAGKLVRTSGCLRSRQVNLSDVTRAVWQRFPGTGGIKLYAGEVCCTVSFSYRGSRELIMFFRNALAEQVQENWERFEAQWVPGRAFRRRLERELAIARVFMIGFGFLIIGVCILWPAGLPAWIRLTGIAVGAFYVVYCSWWLGRRGSSDQHG